MSFKTAHTHPSVSTQILSRVRIREIKMSIPVEKLSALLFSITHQFSGILDLLHSLGKLAYRLLSGFLKESSNALKLFNHHLLIMLGVEDVNCPISACVYSLKENGARN